MAACSFSGIGRDAVDQTIIACDLCGGEPNCVRFCETKAIEFLEKDSIVVQNKNESLQEFRELIKLVEDCSQAGLDQTGRNVDNF